MKKIYIFLSMFLPFVLSGCLVRTYTVEKPRTDLEARGNRGYIVGGGKEESQEHASRLGKTRKYTVVEIELGKSKRRHTEKEETAGEVSSSETASPQAPASQPESEPLFKEESVPEPQGKEAVASEAGQEAAKPVYRMYTVRKNDTLQKISKHFYGTTRRWPKIYKANKDVLKSPDKVYPGQVLKIPQ